MHLGLMGGTFDPVHAGHIAVATAALGCGLDRLEFVPARRPPHKDRPDIADPFHRFAMLALATAGEPRLGVSPWELSREGPSWTIETVRHFSACGHSVALILGTDSLAEIESWREYREILALAGVIAYPRRPVTMEALLDRLPAALAARVRPAGGIAPRAGELLCLSAPERDVSSTEIRRRLASGETVAGMLPAGVEAYIRKHQIYADSGEEAGHQRQP